MKFLSMFFVIIFFISCSKNNVSNSNTSNKSLSPFTVTVVNRAPSTAIITWTSALNINNSDSVKYDIVLNGKLIKTNRLLTSDTFINLSPDTLYTGRVYAKTTSGDTASAAFELEKIGGYIVFGDIDGSINCYDLYTPNRLWKTPANYYYQSIPTIVDSTIYVNLSAQGVFAFNAKTGAKIWSNDLGGSYAITEKTSPVYQDGKIFAVGGGSKIYSLNSLDGKINWSFSEANYLYQSNPVIGSNLLFELANGSQKKIVAININTGVKTWEYMLDCFISKSPLVYKNLLIFGGSDGKIYALNQATGALAWSRSFSANFGSAVVSPKVYKDIVIVQNGISGYLGLNATTGVTIWNFIDAVFSNVSSPAIGNGQVYFTLQISSSSKIYALDAATGVKIWEKPISSYYPTPIFAKNRLYMELYWGIHVLDAQTAAGYNTIAWNVYAIGPPTVVAGDSTFYLSESGMVQ